MGNKTKYPGVKVFILFILTLFLIALLAPNINVIKQIRTIGHTIFKNVAEPKPMVVSHGADDSSSKLFDYSGKVWAVIRNDGGNGDIVFEATLMQDGKRYTKTKKRYFESKETKRMELVFDEAKLLGEKAKFSSRAYAFGK